MTRKRGTQPDLPGMDDLTPVEKLSTERPSSTTVVLGQPSLSNIPDRLRENPGTSTENGDTKENRTFKENRSTNESHDTECRTALANGDSQTMNRILPKRDDLIVAVDCHSLIYQVFHAMPPMTSPSGQAVAAVHGFIRDIADLIEKWQPTFLICTFDLSEETFRNQIYPDYKAHRESMPEDLRTQLPLIRQALDALGIKRFELAGFEADDILAAIAHQADAFQCRCLIVTSDKDCRQLINDRVQMLNIRKSELFGLAELETTWGIRPDQVVDFQSLVGDSVDNVPGVPLIGPKLAQQLLAQYGTLESVLDHADEVNGAKKKENLKLYRQQALMSRDLVRLRRDTPIDIQWDECRAGRIQPAAVQELFRELGFKRLGERFLGLGSKSDGDRSGQIDRSRYQLIADMDSFETLLQELSNAKRISLDTETTSIYPRHADPVGYSFAWKPGEAAYIPLQAPAGDPCLPISIVNDRLRPILESPTILKVGQNLKYDMIVLRGQGIHVAGVDFDTMVADYLIHPGERDHSLDEIAKRELSHQTIKITELIGTGRDQKRMDQVPVQLVAEYAAEDADIPLRLIDTFEARLKAEELDTLFRDLELPLIDVLVEIEFNGVYVDVLRLKSLSEFFSKQIAVLRSEVLQLAGVDFNLDSPKQLAEILFQRLKLPIVKKTKTGPSTDVEVLQELALIHELPGKIIEYRQATKLKSTYVDSLPELVCAKTGRIHSSFRQDVAATGRLSSTDPNLQNIPIRTEDGRQIRSAFRPEQDGWILLTADYSQIELRVLTHYCGDATLQHAFAEDIDIHTLVASQVYNVHLADVSSSMRRSAKAINFGIIYGQSPFGLAKALRISKAEAADFIDAYFSRYSGVQAFIADTIQGCREKGYVKTMLGRKRFIKGVRDFASLDLAKRKTLIEPERMAVNTVIQGSAADLIKLAMIRVYRSMKNRPLRAKMLLQIHDELVFEVDAHDAVELAELVKHDMVNAANLLVPLKVDVKTGPTWADCEPV